MNLLGLISLPSLQLLFFMYSIHLKHSETDREGKGSTVAITQINSAFCPLSSMIWYLQQRPHSNPNEPLYLTVKGRPVSRSWFTTRLRLICQDCGLPPHLYTSHSLRIGAATTAAKVVPASTVKAMECKLLQHIVRHTKVVVMQGCMAAPT